MSMGDVTLTTNAGERTFRLMGAMSLIGGEPSWAVAERMKRQPVTWWNGRALYGLEMPLIIDGWASKTSVEAALLWVRGLLAASNDNGVAVGPTVQVSGIGLPRVPHKNLSSMDFVAVGIEVDPETIIRDEAGNLLRCVATLTLQEFVAPPVVKANLTLTQSASQSRILRIMVKKGDNYATISSRPGIPKQHRAKVKAFFRKNPETNTIAKLRKRAGKIYSVPV